MSNHELRNALHELDMLSVTVDGSESFIGDVLRKLGTEVKDGLSSAGKFAGEKTVQALKSTNTALIKHMGTRRMLLSHMLGRVNKGEAKEEVTFPATLLNHYTRTGEPGDLSDSITLVSKALGTVLDYAKDLEAYYHKELAILEGIKNIKNTEDAATILGKLDSLLFPVPKATDIKGIDSFTTHLPGGKQMVYETGPKKYSLVSGDNTAKSAAVTESFAKDEFKRIIGQLNDLVELYKSISDSNNHYVDYLKKFNTVVGKASEHLDTLRGEVSASLLNDLSSRLAGNTLVFTFYTGFMPKVVFYLDDYVETLSSHLSKQFN